MKDYTFANFLYELRVEKELSQFQLGSLLGVSDKAVSKWENGISKPKIEILIKLSKIFNISIDELLSSKKNNSFEETFYENKKLLADVYVDLTEKYGETPSHIIYNRFLSEYYAFITTNPEAILYLMLLKDMKKELQKTGDFFKAEGFINSLFIPYVLGITLINPLPPHYYCPNCKCVEFHSELYTGWDLPEKVCMCGTTLIRDGHNIPFESANQHHLNSNSNHYKLLISKKNIDKIINIARETFDDKISVVYDESATYPTIIVNDNNITENEKYSSLIRKPRTTTISIRTAKIADIISELEMKTGAHIENIVFNNQCLNYIFKNPKNEYIKRLFQKLNPESFTDLIKAESYTRTERLYEDSKECASQHSINKTEIIAYREDVFNYILKHSKEKYTGFALEVMYRASRGRFVNGIPENVLHNLKEINAEQWFIDSLQKIKFLHSKCYGVSEAQFELSYAWYKINHPKITDSLFK